MKRKLTHIKCQTYQRQETATRCCTSREKKYQIESFSESWITDVMALLQRLTSVASLIVRNRTAVSDENQGGGTSGMQNDFMSQSVTPNKVINGN